MAKAKKKKRVVREKILLAEDDCLWAQFTKEHLALYGFDVIVAQDGHAAIDAVRRRRGKIALAIVDLMMPPGSDKIANAISSDTMTGLFVAQEIKRLYPKTKVIIHSLIRSDDMAERCQAVSDAFHPKGFGKSDLVDEVIRFVRPKRKSKRPRIFIVHGHDNEALFDLKNYLQNVLRLPEPTILREQPSLGRTVIEKFEDYASKIDVAFVLLTPDDTGKAKRESRSKRRARQNVVFELGYFLAALKRRGSRVVLLHKGTLELPSDIAGMIYVDISDGILAAGETIRKELADWS